MKFAAIGRTAILLESIRQAIEAGHSCTLIITTNESAESNISTHDFEKLANEIGAVFLSTRHINHADTHVAIKTSEAEIAISLNWPLLIAQTTLDLFPNGIINSHAGDLPRFRGNATPNWAILTGESDMPITLHFMSAGLDTGDILLQRRILIKPDTRVQDIYDFSAQVVPQMFSEALTALENGTLAPQPQPTDPSLALRCYPRLPQDSFIDWNQSAIQIQRLINAVSEPFNGAYTYLGYEKVVIWRASAEAQPTPFLAIAGHVVERRANGEIAIATGDGLLIVQEVQIGDGERSRAGDVIKSVRTRLGMNPADEIAALHQRIAALEAIIKLENH